MEKFGFSGLWQHVGSSVLAFALAFGDGLVSYLGVVQLPNWAHALVGVVALLLAAYKGAPKPAATP